MPRLLALAASAARAAARAAARPFRRRGRAYDRAGAHRAEVDRAAAVSRHHRAANHTCTGGGSAQ
ncbi:hypothetical protein [Kitasatospora phosalacinea]|uniref:Uncharacterized protein n=1 Tax=Kitasatospora phosalacinea TaxID=2065 RepID=A0A9W6PCF3_9ACTN|nr:hypothetical protein [Kitasatospora phosalacinea]GLW52433.1 hypothetical protein Kpho01_04440 [Kitasatospora phosalacinea]